MDLYICYVYFLAIGAAVGAVVIVGVVALSLIIILWKCKRTTKGIVISAPDPHLITVLVSSTVFSILCLVIFQSNLRKKMSIQKGI